VHCRCAPEGDDRCASGARGRLATACQPRLCCTGDAGARPPCSEHTQRTFPSRRGFKCTGLILNRARHGYFASVEHDVDRLPHCHIRNVFRKTIISHIQVLTCQAGPDVSPLGRMASRQRRRLLLLQLTPLLRRGLRVAPQGLPSFAGAPHSASASGKPKGALSRLGFKVTD